MQVLALFTAVSAINYLGRDTIAYQRMNSNESIKSSSQQYELVMQTDGNLVFYDRWANSRVVWASNTEGNYGAYLEAQGDGNLVLYSKGRALWATNTDRKSDCKLYLRNEGALEYTCRAQSRWCVGHGCGGLLHHCKVVVCPLVCQGVSVPNSSIGTCYGQCRGACDRCGEPSCR